MEENATVNKFPKKVKPELLIALLAVFISFLTLFVYLYQSTIMKTQQKMSVWPHVTFGPSWGSDYFTINLINKGVGPAIIKNVSVEINNSQIDGIHEIMKFVPDSLQSEYNYSSLFVGQVIMAGEKIQLFQSRNTGTIRYLLKLMESEKIKIEVCYCSVYNDCWTSTGIKVTESNCDQE
jgi:hypothetical protein